MKCKRVPKSLTNLVQIEEGMMLALLHELLMPLNGSDSSIQNSTNLQRNKYSSVPTHLSPQNVHFLGARRFLS